VNWILDADIQVFFDSIDHEWMVRFLEHRVADRRILRLIRNWLKAGVLEDGHRVAAERGTPQGAVISPLLANIFLHYVFAQFRLALHPDKTRLLRFGRYALRQRQERGDCKPKTFDFLGFTHCCGQNHTVGFKLIRLTIKKRMRATLVAIRQTLRRRRHEPVPVVGRWVRRVLPELPRDAWQSASSERFPQQDLP